jgi:hypothetical protein
MAKFTNPRDRGELTDEPDTPSTQVDIAAIVQAAVTAALAAGKQDSHELADAITKGMQQVAAPIHEYKQSDGVSELNPLGDRDYPRPGLKCRMWYGIVDDQDDNKVKRAFEIYDHDISLWEQLALNMLTPMEKVIKKLDGSDLRVTVVEQRNQASGALERMVIGLPLAVLSKKGDATTRNMVPAIPSLVYQLTGHDFRPESLPLPASREYLIAVMAAHRRGEYVCPKPQQVAA